MKTYLTLSLIISLFFITINGCSNKPDVSGKWSGNVQYDEHLLTIVHVNLNLDLLLSQSEKNINGTLTLRGTINETINLQGFIEGELISLKYQDVYGQQTNIQGTLKGNKIIGTLSMPGMSGRSVNLELTRMN